VTRPPFTDTHVHFHDLRPEQLHYSWLLPGTPEDEDLGDYGAIRSERYWADDFLAEVRFQNVERVVHVQSATGIDDPVEETRWLQAFADRLGVPHGIVAAADLSAPDVRALLERHLEFPIVRGIRDLRYDDYASNPAWEAGYAALAELGLVCCDDPLLEHVPAIAALAGRHPEVTLCIDHACFPRRRDDDYFAEWRAAIHTLADVPSTVMKISGLGMCDHDWTVDSLRPWVLACIEEFGVERSFFGTNWPVDRLFSSYGDVLDAYAQIVSDFSPDEQRALLTGNAKRIFRV
jgi:predicted TIM-barrel fold metal-dependent hydrolase